MTRYSTSRGMMYSAPPGPDDESADDAADEADRPVEPEPATGEPTAADD